MITFTKKADPQPAPTETEQNRFEQIRKAAEEGHRKVGTDGARRRRAQETAKDDRLL